MSFAVAQSSCPHHLTTPSQLQHITYAQTHAKAFASSTPFHPSPVRPFPATTSTRKVHHRHTMSSSGSTLLSPSETKSGESGEVVPLGGGAPVKAVIKNVDSEWYESAAGIPDVWRRCLADGLFSRSQCSASCRPQLSIATPPSPTSLPRPFRHIIAISLPAPRTTHVTHLSIIDPQRALRPPIPIPIPIPCQPQLHSQSHAPQCPRRCSSAPSTSLPQRSRGTTSKRISRCSSRGSLTGCTARHGIALWAKSESIGPLVPRFEPHQDWWAGSTSNALSICYRTDRR